MWDGLDDFTIRGHMANGPLAHSGAAQTKDVAGRNTSTLISREIIATPSLPGAFVNIPFHIFFFHSTSPKHFTFSLFTLTYLNNT